MQPEREPGALIGRRLGEFVVVQPLSGGGFFLFYPCLLGALPGGAFLVGGPPQPVGFPDLLYALSAELLCFRPQTLRGRVISLALPHLMVNRSAPEQLLPTLVKHVHSV